MQHLPVDPTVKTLDFSKPVQTESRGEPVLGGENYMMRPRSDSPELTGYNTTNHTKHGSGGTGLMHSRDMTLGDADANVRYTKPADGGPEGTTT
jgi:hypothetical protein